MKRQQILGSLIVVCAAAMLTSTLGCGEAEPRSSKKPMSIGDHATSAPPVVPAPAVLVTPPPAPELIKAEVGVGKKGRGYGGGIITESAHQYFAAKERIAFEIQIPKAMQLYKVEHNDKGPKTQEIFMREIIEASAIKLPELPAGHKYKYDVEAEELMVEIPAPTSEPAPASP